ncbi:MAG: (d)CMP kinase [Proteobacteria bacterium]|nr:(d)CMP kinase [Pseudomonadota bacterium]MDA0926918.1 (d)CMP kinase [Pseudomonadota bacterium]
MTGDSAAVPVIAIDGPSGTGKGTVANHVARSLGFHLLDSGALYRVLGIAVAKRGIDLQDVDTVAAVARDLDLEFGSSGPGSIHLNGEDVSLEIRTDLGSDMASRVGAIPQARAALLERQLAFRKPPGLVADGRDMGTVVFPDSILKIYLTASAEERANRRYKQLIDKGMDVKLPALLQDLTERDARDSERSISPLKPAADAFVLDTTTLSEKQVMDRVMEMVSRALEQA